MWSNAGKEKAYEHICKHTYVELGLRKHTPNCWQWGWEQD